MKRYDLSKIMTNAHKLYKNARSKYATFGEALKKAWGMEKFQVRIAEERAKLEAERQEREQTERERSEKAAAESVVALARIKAGQIMSEAYAKAERMEREAEARKEGVSYSDYIARMSEAVGYGNGRYCGD